MPEAAGCFDCNCPKCGRKISWRGRWSDRPACRCGYRLPEDGTTGPVLERVLTHARADALSMAPAGLAAARVEAGLRLGQAANLLGVHYLDLEAMEGGRRPAPAELRKKMNRVYGMGGERDVPKEPHANPTDQPLPAVRAVRPPGAA